MAKKGNDAYNYEEKYPEDAVYEETAPNARVNDSFSLALRLPMNENCAEPIVVSDEMADSEVELCDREDLCDYYEELVKRREEAFRNPLRKGCSFTIDIDPHPPGSGEFSRPLPSFALNGGTYKLKMTYAIRPYRYDKQLSQIYIADVRSPAAPAQSLGKVVLKIVQPSLLPLPDIDYPYGLYEYLRASVVSTSEDEAYKELKSLQGTTVPYYYGMHPVLMPNDEDSDVLIMEYIESKGLGDWLSERPEHTKPEDLGDSDTKYMEETKRVFKKVLTGLHSIHKLGVVYRHLDTSNIILTPDSFGTPVFVDFALTACHVDAEDIVLYANNYQVSFPLRECCEPHNDVMEEWLEEEVAKREETSI